jgi:ketosteroid isomerase-like protein
MSAENVRAFMRATDAWNRDDFDAWISFFHPDVSWTAVLEAYRGLEGARQAWDDFKAHQLTIHHNEVRDLGDSVLALGEVTAVGPTTGLATGSELAQLVTERDGKAIRIRDFASHAEGLAAAGLEV